MLKVLNIILQAVVVHGEEILSGGKLRSVLCGNVQNEL